MSDDVTESALITGFMKWAQANAIPLKSLNYDEIYEYVCRYLKAAG